jgi:hypothetical protein
LCYYRLNNNIRIGTKKLIIVTAELHRLRHNKQKRKEGRKEGREGGVGFRVECNQKG